MTLEIDLTDDEVTQWENLTEDQQEHAVNLLLEVIQNPNNYRLILV